MFYLVLRSMKYQCPPRAQIEVLRMSIKVQNQVATNIHICSKSECYECPSWSKIKSLQISTWIQNKSATNFYQSQKSAATNIHLCLKSECYEYPLCSKSEFYECPPFRYDCSNSSLCFSCYCIVNVMSIMLFLEY